MIGEKEPHAATRRLTFEEFFEETADRLTGLLGLLTGSREEAGEMAQDAYVRVFERWDRVSRMDNPAGYLYRVAVNARRSRLRRLGKEVRTKSDAIDPDDAFASVDRRDEILRALARLSRPLREAVVVCEWLELPDQEAADVLGITVSALRVRTMRARRQLRELLEERHA